MNKQKGIAQIAVMAVMLFLAIALPVTTNLVQKNTENRSKAVSYGISKEGCEASYGKCEDSCSDGYSQLKDENGDDLVCNWTGIFSNQKCCVNLSLNNSGTQQQGNCVDNKGVVHKDWEMWCEGSNWLYFCSDGDITQTYCTIDDNNNVNNCKIYCKPQESTVDDNSTTSTCTTDFDCPEHKICTKGGSFAGNCVPSYENYACSQDRQCLIGALCINGNCSTSSNTGGGSATDPDQGCTNMNGTCQDFGQPLENGSYCTTNGVSGHVVVGTGDPWPCGAGGDNYLCCVPNSNGTPVGGAGDESLPKYYCSNAQAKCVEAVGTFEEVDNIMVNGVADNTLGITWGYSQKDGCEDPCEIAPARKWSYCNNSKQCVYSYYKGDDTINNVDNLADNALDKTWYGYQKDTLCATECAKTTGVTCTNKCTNGVAGANTALGDANCDGRRDLIDFSIWRSEKNDGKQPFGTEIWAADFDCINGTTDVDYQIWLNNRT